MNKCINKPRCKPVHSKQTWYYCIPTKNLDMPVTYTEKSLNAKLLTDFG